MQGYNNQNPGENRENSIILKGNIPWKNNWI